MSNQYMYTLVYNGWGRGIHTQEIEFSVLTALLKLKQDVPKVRIVVYTDDPAVFERLPVEIVALSNEQLREWRGSADFLYRIKIAVLADCLGRYPVPTILIDSDTYFMRSPLKLFRRIQPGRSLLHVWECVLRDAMSPEYAMIPQKMNDAKVTDRHGQPDIYPPDMASWNSGIVGLHPADAALLDDVLCASDNLHRVTGVRTSEQLAFDHVLTKHTRVRSAWDVVYHYYTWRLRSQFKIALPKILTEANNIPDADRAQWLYDRRPRCRFRRRIRVRAEHALRRLGFLRSKVVINSESY
jgi:hypothetical protein